MTRHQHRRPRGQEGVALVIILVFVVLLTGVVLTYFSRSISDRQMSNSSFNQSKADEMARSALDVVTSGLKQEIVNGSTTLPSPNPDNLPLVYQPVSSANMVPIRNGAPAPVAGQYPIPNLLRVSTTTAMAFPGADYAAASNASTTESSANGRSISLARWNQHYLIPRNPATYAGANANKIGTDPLPSFVAPNWIFVTMNGPASPPLTAPSDTVIGRYAYALYDESGLLDVNVAGYPSTLPANGIHPAPNPANRLQMGFAGKGSAAFADLTKLGLTSAQVNNLVGWRNYASAQPAGSFDSSFTFDASGAARYFDNVASNTNGFLQVSAAPLGGRTDQAFLSRQQLIHLRQALGFSQDALQFLGTFSRAVTAPSWSPGTPGTSSIPYAANAELPGSANRNLANVRVKTTATVKHYLDDGSAAPVTYTAQKGDPLLTARFSLARLGWLSQANPDTGAAPSSAYANAIQDCFGLVWGIVGNANGGNSCWSYVGSSGSGFDGTIKTLDQIAAEGREPNFFELLKAAILSGSLGLSPGPAAFVNGSSTAGGFNYHSGVPQIKGCDGLYSNTFDRVPGNIPAPSQISDLQVIQIGANIIDQYDADSYPTAINFRYKYPSSAAQIGSPYAATTTVFGSVDTVYGEENLPYLQGMAIVTCTTDGGLAGNLADWWQPVLWNPHQAPNSANTASLPPKTYKVEGYGQAKLSWTVTSYKETLASTAIVKSGTSPAQTFDGVQSISFTDNAPATSAFYAAPLLLTQNTIPNVIATTSIADMKANSAMPNYAGNPFVGFWGGTDPDYTGTGVTYSFCNISAIAGPAASFCLGWVDTGGKFHPYSFLSGLFAHTYGVINNSHTAADSAGNASPYKTQAEAHQYADNRTARFSSLTTWEYPAAPKTMYSNKTSHNVDTYGSGKPNSSAFTWATTSIYGFYDEDWAVNQEVPAASTGATSTYYKDPDGVIRPGDGVYGNMTTGDGMLLFTSNGAPTGTPLPAGDSAGNTQHGRRPIVLNRPFRSVGELGFAYRDLPFKSLDFFSSLSADAALLDVFSVTDEPALVAGKVNVNSAPSEVLQAIMAGGGKKDRDPAYNLGAVGGELKNIAQNILSELNPGSGPNPISNRADLVTRLAPVMRTALTSSGDLANKAYFEAPVRALADVTNTRTWNLLVDVVAQTGSFPPQAPSSPGALNSSFYVQGERRYWLHIAIDRYTGQIVDQQLEAVYE